MPPLILCYNQHIFNEFVLQALIMPYPPPFDSKKLIVRILTIVAIYLVYHWLTTPNLSINKIVEQDPELVLVPDGKVWKVDDYPGYTFKEVATLKLRAKVLSTHSYGWWNSWLEVYETDSTDIEPEDFFLGWGQMSDNRIWSKIDFFKDDHEYELTIPQKFPLDLHYIEWHSDNAHMIPANLHIRYLLRQIKVNDIVRFNGYLVNVTFPNGARWNSGFDHRNHDLGTFVCFVYFVTEVWIEDSD
jgi:hypothetical protein